MQLLFAKWSQEESILIWGNIDIEKETQSLCSLYEEREKKAGQHKSRENSTCLFSQAA